MHYIPERVYTHEPDEEVCNCLGVPRWAIQESVDGGHETVCDVGEDCDAGGGCGECHGEIARMIAARLLGRAPALTGQTPLEAIEGTLRPLAARIGAGLKVRSADPWEIVLEVEGGDHLKQTVALWAEVLIEPLMEDGAYIEVG